MSEDSEIEPLAYPLWPDTGKALKLGRNGTYDAARRGQIPTIRLGRLLKVPAWFHKQLRDGAAKPDVG
jgi:hypothetical protein